MEIHAWKFEVLALDTDARAQTRQNGVWLWKLIDAAADSSNN